MSRSFSSSTYLYQGRRPIPGGPRDQAAAMLGKSHVAEITVRVVSD